MTHEYSDRLDPVEYDDDPPVHVYRCDRVGPPSDGLWIPERLWHRVRLIGAAYHTHLLPALDGSSDPVFLSGAQCRGLEDELRFVGELVADPLVENLVSEMLALLAEPSQGASKDLVGVEFS